LILCARDISSLIELFMAKNTISPILEFVNDLDGICALLAEFQLSEGSEMPVFARVWLLKSLVRGCADRPQSLRDASWP